MAFRWGVSRTKTRSPKYSEREEGGRRLEREMVSQAGGAMNRRCRFLGWAAVLGGDDNLKGEQMTAQLRQVAKYEVEEDSTS